MNSFLDTLLNTPSNLHVSYEQVLISLVLAFVLTRVVIFTYHRVVDDPLPPKDISNHITLICLVTTLIIIPISTNAILSLGMVGALSIVRFRTAIKSPTDTAFVYWALAIGIALGAQFFMPAVVGTFAMAFLMEVNQKFMRSTTEKYIVNLEFSTEFEQSVYEEIQSKGKILSQVRRDNTIYLCLECTSLDISRKIQSIGNIVQCEVVSYKGDFVS